MLFGAASMPADAERRESTLWLSDTPHPVTWSDVERLNTKGLVVMSRAVYGDPPPPGRTAYPNDGIDGDAGTPPLNLALVIGGLVLLEVVLLAGPAFIVGARQRQRDLALVAVNGGRPAHLRRIVLADGVVAGAAAAILGVGLGIAIAFALRPVMENDLVGARAGGYRVFPLALLGVAGLGVLAGALAAMVPAFTAARFNLVAALAGRRGILRSRRRWLVVGMAIVGAGAASSAYGALTVSPNALVTGLIMVECGLIFCIPALIGLLSRLGPFTPPSLRIALRDMARNRASAAPAISAVMAAVASSVAIGVYLTSNAGREEAMYQSGLPSGYVTIDYVDDAERLTKMGADNPVIAAAKSTLPVKDLTETLGFTCAGTVASGDFCTMFMVRPPDRRCFMLDLPRPYTAEQQRRALADPRCDADGAGAPPGSSLMGVVDDPRQLGILTQASAAELAEAEKMLKSGGIVVRDRNYVQDGKATLAVLDSRVSGQSQLPDQLPTVAVPAYVLTTGYGDAGQMFIASSAVTKAGLAFRPNGVVVATTRMPSQAEEDRLKQELLIVSNDVSKYASVERGSHRRTDPRVAILAVVAAFITLGATGAATGLAAADSRADLSTLAAVGASVRIRRALSLAQSGLIGGLGSALGLIVGAGAALTILMSHNRSTAGQWPRSTPFSLLVPWATVLVLVAVPLFGMLGAGLLTRSRLPVERPQG
ncbi:FtsX-like permease family protein [Dactylosporangium sp. NPDC000555]|uniref:FtsX-like permease family protein n=1 Tax=Dactylosporangium sp. NPDC000555 TaxID=3154260 RepID=UPI00332DC8E3